MSGFKICPRLTIGRCDFARLPNLGCDAVVVASPLVVSILECSNPHLIGNVLGHEDGVELPAG